MAEMEILSFPCSYRHKLCARPQGLDLAEGGEGGTGAL